MRPKRRSSGVAHDEAFHFLHRREDVNGAVDLAQRARYFDVTGVADDDDLPALTRVPLRLPVQRDADNSPTIAPRAA